MSDEMESYEAEEEEEESSDDINQNEITKLNERIANISKKGNFLKEREMQLSNGVKELIVKINEIKRIEFCEKIASLREKYQELVVKEQNLLSKPFISPDDKEKFMQYKTQIDNMISTICEYEDRIHKIKDILNRSYKEKRLPNGKYSLSITDVYSYDD